jgi:hypothetical protein
VPLEVVEHDGYFYATLDFVPPDSRFANVHVSRTDLRDGWELAPDDNSIVEAVIKPYRWGGSRIVVANGKSYLSRLGGISGSHVGEAGSVAEASGQLESCGNTFKPKKGIGDGRVLIRTLALNSHGGSSSNSDTVSASLWKKRRFTDYVIVCEGQELPCHREILASASPVFDRVLSSKEYSEGNSNQYEIKNSKPIVVTSMVEFMYTGSFSDSPDLVELLCLADQYAVEGLVRYCSLLLIDSIGPDNVVAITRALKGFKNEEGFKGIWKQVIEKVKADHQMLELVMDSL